MDIIAMFVNVVLTYQPNIAVLVINVLQDLTIIVNG